MVYIYKRVDLRYIEKNNKKKKRNKNVIHFHANLPQEIYKKIMKTIIKQK